MTSLWITIPATLLLAALLLGLVVRAVLHGDFDDLEGPSVRMLHDDDHVPESAGTDVADAGAAPVEPSGTPRS